MKKIILMLAAIVFLASCGGGGSTSDETGDVTGEPNAIVPVDDTGDEEASANETVDDAEGLPAIQDDFEDTLFVYSDMSLYVGTYNLNSQINSCNHSAASVEVLSMDSSWLNTVTDGVNESFPYVSHNVADLYTYGFQVGGTYCILGLASGNSTIENRTLDFLGLYCEDSTTSGVCYTEWQRYAAYDFTSTVIKSVERSESASLQDLLIEIANFQ